MNRHRALLAAAFLTSALSGPSSAASQDFADVRRGLASDAPKPPKGRSTASASRLKVRDNLPPNLKAIESETNEAWTTLRGDSRKKVDSVKQGFQLLDTPVESVPDLKQKFDATMDGYSQRFMSLVELMKGEATILKYVDAWLDSISEGHPRIPAEDFQFVKGELSKLENVFYLQDEIFSAGSKDPNLQAANRKVKEDAVALEQLVQELSKRNPDRTHDWAKAEEKLKASAFTELIGSLKKASVPTIKAATALIESAEKAGWVSGDN